MNHFRQLVKNNKIMTFVPSISSVFQMLENHAREFDHKEALVSLNVDTNERNAILYKDLNLYVKKTAAYLLAQGIIQNDRIAILMDNTVEILLLELAAGTIGAVIVPLDSKRDTLKRKQFKLEDTQVKLLFVKAALDPEELEQLSHQTKIICFSTFSEFLHLISKFSAKIYKTNTINLSSLYLILYTSGTTALPKGVPLTQEAIVANAEGIVKWQGLSPEDRFNIILPLHHINSTTMSLSTILVGGTVLLNSRYSASKFWNIVSRERATLTSIVPTVLHDLLIRHEEFRQARLKIKSLKRILIGSAPVLPQETLKFYKLFGTPIIQGYGQTETALRVTGVPLNLSAQQYISAVKSNTIGTELANCNVAILKKDGVETKAKEAGEICIRGPILAEGYLNNIEATKESFYDGWFHSDDLGYWDFKNGQKYFFIIGRLKEIIIKGGVNLSPALIEDALLKSFPEIDEVSIVGFPDSRMGEEIAAAVVFKDKHKKQDSNLIQQILTAVSENKISGLSPYETPKKVFFVDSLPKTSTGKIQRVEVKKMVADKLKGIDLPHYFISQIKPNETQILKSAVVINNQRWLGLPTTLNEFRARAQNGLLFGVFEEKIGIVGSLSCIQLPWKKVVNLTTWNETTANGTLANHNPKGNTLLCVAISVIQNTAPSSLRGSSLKKDETIFTSVISIRSLAERNLVTGGSASPDSSPSAQNDKLEKVAKQKIEAYVNSNLDHVLNFHRKPKGGLPGATVWKILENGRPDDTEAVGYNVLMKYPEIPKSTQIIHSTSSIPSIMLIESALMYAQKHGIKYVIAFSRPAGFREWLNELSRSKSTGNSFD